MREKINLVAEKVCLCPSVAKANDLVELAKAVGVESQFAPIVADDECNDSNFGHLVTLPLASFASNKDTRFIRCRAAPLTTAGLPSLPNGAVRIEKDVEETDATVLRVLIPKQAVEPSFWSDMSATPVETVMRRGLGISPDTLLNTYGWKPVRYEKETVFEGYVKLGKVPAGEMEKLGGRNGIFPIPLAANTGFREKGPLRHRRRMKSSRIIWHGCKSGQARSTRISSFAKEAEHPLAFQHQLESR